MKVKTAWIAFATLSLFAVGCGGEEINTGHSPNIRAVDAIFEPSAVTVQFDQPGVNDHSLTLGQATPFVTVTDIDQKIVFVDSATDQILVRGDQSFFRSDRFYTMVASRLGSDTYRSYAFESPTTNPSDGTCSYRIINTLPDPDDIDVFLVAVGGSIDGVVPIEDDLPATGASDFLSTTGGDYRLVVKDSLSAAILLDQTINLPANKSVSLLVLAQSADAQQSAATLSILPENAPGG